MKKAAILAADGFEEIETIVPYDLLTRAGIDTKLVSVQNKHTLTGANGLVIDDPVLMKEYDFAGTDALIVPGGPGFEILKNTPEVIEQIKAFAADENKVLGAICAGSSILGELGIYKGKNYTCVPDLNRDFGGHFEKVHAVTDGNLVTGISVGGAFAFAFDLIAKITSAENARQLEAGTCYTL